jgi:hypothetical protein
MDKSYSLTYILICTLLVLTALIYFTKDGFIGRRNYIEDLNYGVPLFNFGTREWAPTHLMSYDVRGDIPISYYPNGIFNQPEWPYRFYYPYLEPNFYTYEYVNPVQGFYPPEYNSNYSVPFKVDNKNSTSGYKPIDNKELLSKY